MIESFDPDSVIRGLEHENNTVTTEPLEKEKLLADEDTRNKRLRNDQLEQDLKERKRYADRIFSLILGWLSILALILVLQGIINNGFNLSEPVLLAYIGGTTANVLGLFIFVLKYLFPAQKK